MAKRKRRKTSKHQSVFSYMLVFAGMVCVCVFLAVKMVSLGAQSRELDREEAILQAKIEAANIEHDNLVAQEAYMQTNEYIEDVAKSKLGLVFPYEIVIKPNE